MNNDQISKIRQASELAIRQNLNTLECRDDVIQAIHELAKPKGIADALRVQRIA